MKKEKTVKGDFVGKVDEAEQKKAVKAEKGKKEKVKKPNIFSRIGKKCKDVFSELKKVSWPTFPKVLKQTGVVIGVVLVFLVVIGAFDFGLMELLKLVSPKNGG